MPEFYTDEELKGGTLTTDLTEEQAAKLAEYFGELAKAKKEEKE